MTATQTIETHTFAPSVPLEGMPDHELVRIIAEAAWIIADRHAGRRHVAAHTDALSDHAADLDALLDNLPARPEQ